MKTFAHKRTSKRGASANYAFGEEFLVIRDILGSYPGFPSIDFLSASRLVD
jgi:hypothetical protein